MQELHSTRPHPLSVNHCSRYNSLQRFKSLLLFLCCSVWIVSVLFLRQLSNVLQVSHSILKKRYSYFSYDFQGPSNHKNITYLVQKLEVPTGFLLITYRCSLQMKPSRMTLAVPVSTCTLLNSQYSMTMRVSRYQNGKPLWNLMQQEMMGMQCCKPDVQNSSYIITIRIPLNKQFFYRPDDDDI